MEILAFFDEWHDTLEQRKSEGGGGGDGEDWERYMPLPLPLRRPTLIQNRQVVEQRGPIYQPSQYQPALLQDIYEHKFSHIHMIRMNLEAQGNPTARTANRNHGPCWRTINEACMDIRHTRLNARKNTSAGDDFNLADLRSRIMMAVTTGIDGVTFFFNSSRLKFKSGSD